MQTTDGKNVKPSQINNTVYNRTRPEKEMLYKQGRYVIKRNITAEYINSAEST